MLRFCLQEDGSGDSGDTLGDKASGMPDDDETEIVGDDPSELIMTDDLTNLKDDEARLFLPIKL